MFRLGVMSASFLGPFTERQCCENAFVRRDASAAGVKGQGKRCFRPKPRRFFWGSCLAPLFFVTALLRAENLLTPDPSLTDFHLVTENGAATICLDAGADRAVSRAADDLGADIERVSGTMPAIARDPTKIAGEAVLVGVVGQSPMLDRLVAAGKLDVSALKGNWETYVIATVDKPLPNLRRALVVVGSDRRGAIYGVYEVSKAIGVSPWYWWADVAPVRQKTLSIAGGTRRFGPPSVKYRGIFINDEDWGLQPWAATTFEPERHGIGPKTYAKIFELLLRLKANTLWPAMHACSPAFNASPENAALADAYGIVMGSSHAEPMLRNNVSEWKAAVETYNYLSNREGVLNYWEQRVATNGGYEGIYTLGMRGIHDSAMMGPKTDAERIQTLERIFSDQRALLARHVRPDVDRVPQIFCAYKEVLPLYRGGLKVPQDVTVMFPDDNFGYIRDFPSAAERGRAGGFGVYYHLSYLGSPMSYLWLETTPPALIWEEMAKAFASGADRIWIANVGDLKPAEIGTEFFLDLAWNAHRWDQRNPDDFLAAWAAREFGEEKAAEIADMLRAYYLLNYQRKPEHLQWWLSGQKPAPSPLTDEEIGQRLDAFAALRVRADTIMTTLPEEKRDAFFQLVAYPIRGSALANERYFLGELSVRRAKADVADAELVARAEKANTELKEQTRVFNEEIAGGKWRGIMSAEPADQQWRSMRIERWALPRFQIAKPSPSDAESAHVVARDAAHFDRKKDLPSAHWEIVPGLGRTGKAMAVFPLNAATIPLDRLASDSPRLEYDVDFSTPGEYVVSVYLLPTHPPVGGKFRFALALDGDQPKEVALASNDGGSAWAQGVLNATRIASTSLDVHSSGRRTLNVYMVDSGVVIDKIAVALKGRAHPPGYLGPPEGAR